MTIRAFRLYFYCRDKDAEKRISKTHWGISYWINERLKTIRPRLRGSEVKGINLANVCFSEPGTSHTPIGQWRRMLNGLEFGVEYDIASLEARPARENLPGLLRVAAEAACSAEHYPQLRAIGELLLHPLTAADLDDIQREIDVPLEVRQAPAQAKIARLQQRANTSIERTRER
jgi:hypothetical protein